ncbi:MAG: nucleoside-triphosphatase [Anaerolineae bacterium]|nr:nucleoside-triphosphatase [Anaerolineae bacterium]
MSGPVIGLLTGPVGIGKTTVAERLVGLCRRQGVRCGGLLAPPIKNSCGQKAGIWGVDISSGERRILARTDRDLGGAAVGPYSFDAGALAWAVSVIEQAMGSCDLLIVDEIGKLELWQGQGLAPLLPRLAAGEAERALILVRDSLLEELQARFPAGSQAVFQATEGNRGQLPGQILATLTRWTTAEAQAQQREKPGGKLL